MDLSLQNVAFGTAVIDKKVVATATAAAFAYQQDQVDTFMSTVTSGHYLSISMRIKPTNFTAEQKYGYDYDKDFQVFNVEFDTSYQVTAASLRTLIAAAFPDLSVTEGGGLITISTNGNYGLEIEYEYFRYLTRTEVSQAVDLTTTSGDATLTGTVTGGAMRYTETEGVTPTTTLGEYVSSGGFFKIIGKTNIINALFIQETATATINYRIFM